MPPRVPSNSSETTFDVIIIGAGINGAGIARDAAMRGLKVLLLDKGDIAAGTTSWSTRLIHGGLRYLEHGEIGLVRESLRERETLFRIAPHLVRPLPILIPIYDDAQRGTWTIRTGMLAYDLLSFTKTLTRHRMLSSEEALRQAPGLNPEGLRGAALYYDAQVEFAERLALENTIAAKDLGATVVTYAKVDRLIVEENSVRGVEFTDVLGDAGSCAVRGRLVVNAAGPWVDEILAKLNQTSPRMIGGTKGSHLIVAPFPGAPTNALYVEAHADHRPFFIIPWNGNYLIGTTDISYQGDLDRVEIDDQETVYLLNETNRAIPGAKLRRDSILFSYSGVRPLPFVGDRDERHITRHHFIGKHPRFGGLISIVGGKLTTYRNLSQQTVDQLFLSLGKQPPKCTTGETPLPGAITHDFAAFGRQFNRKSHLPAGVNERLLRVYGTRALEVLKLTCERSDLAEPLCDTEAIAAEVVFSFASELAQTLGDCLLRRTMLGLGPSVGIGEDAAAARIAQEYLGWPESRAEKEVIAYRKYIERFHPGLQRLS
jgi:glycerol-3-phosphate dehydrogenase